MLSLNRALFGASLVKLLVVREINYGSCWRRIALALKELGEHVIRATVFIQTAGQNQIYTLSTTFYSTDLVLS